MVVVAMENQVEVEAAPTEVTHVRPREDAVTEHVAMAVVAEGGALIGMIKLRRATEVGAAVVGVLEVALIQCLLP